MRKLRSAGNLSLKGRREW
jgi:hypothetical protein